MNAAADSFRPFSQSNVSQQAKQSFVLHKQTLLSTIVFNVKDAYGKYQRCRALLDSGSQDNYIKAEFAEKLGLRLDGACITIKGIHGKTSLVRHTVSTANITGILPGTPINLHELSIPKDCFLADPTFHQPAEVDMFIGMEDTSCSFPKS